MSFAHSFYTRMRQFFFTQRKKCAELTDARSVFLRARSRPIGSVTRSLESFPPPLLFQGRATGKKILELVARNVLGLLASAIACFSIGVLLFEVQCISFCDWSWICLRAYRSYARFYERTKVFFWLLLRSIFHKNLSGGTVTFYPAACFPLDPFLAQVFEA